MLPLYFFQSKKFLKFQFAGEKYEVVGETPKLGKRFKFWFLTFDMYYCEEEPEIEPVRGLHMVGWHVPKNKDVYEDIKKTGWFGPLGKYIPVTNPTPFIDARDSEYFKKWSKRKQEYRKSWLKQLESNKLQLVNCDFDTFVGQYTNSNLLKKVKNYNQKQMKKILEIYKENMLFFLVRDNYIDKTVAGLCLLCDRELDQVIKQYSFVDKNYKNIGTGLVDQCIKYAVKNNFSYVNLTLIDTAYHGDKSWQGFTQFKLEFNPIVIYFRQSYFKITFDW
jgi:hypothetical protein